MTYCSISLLSDIRHLTCLHFDSFDVTLWFICCIHFCFVDLKWRLNDCLMSTFWTKRCQWKFRKCSSDTCNVESFCYLFNIFQAKKRQLSDFPNIRLKVNSTFVIYPCPGSVLTYVYTSSLFCWLKMNKHSSLLYLQKRTTMFDELEWPGKYLITNNS